MNEFRYTAYAQEVIFGAGALAKLPDAVDMYGWSRLMLCASPSLLKNGVVAQIESLLGKRLVITFAEVAAHVQEAQVNRVTALAEQNNIDAVIGVGGGSPLGMAKAVSLGLEGRRIGVEAAQSHYPPVPPRVPSIAIPTTYAGSEMTPTYGITRMMEDGSTRKVTVRDDKIPPKLVIYDPALTLDLPPSVTAATGINALAHCVEALYSINRNPLSTAAALSGIKTIAGSLLRCYQHGDDLAARTNMLIGANLGGQSLATVKMGVHHGTCHVLGGTAGVAHGVANAIVLPHAMRFNLDSADGIRIAPMIALVGEAMEVSVRRDGVNDEEIGEMAAQAVYDLVAQMGLPQRLRDVGISEDMLPMLAENMLKSKAVQDNPKPVTLDGALGLLRAAW